MGGFASVLFFVFILNRELSILEAAFFILVFIAYVFFLFDEAEKAAMAGVASSQKSWGATGKDNRKLLDGQHEHLKATAVDADKARTVDTAKQATNAATGEVTVTFEQVIAKLDKAATEDALYIAFDWGNAMDDQSRMGEIETHFNARLSTIRGE